MKMKKKLFSAVILATLLSTVLFTQISVVKAHTESDPLKIDLLAGKTLDVGDVLVWNDEGYLYVKYVTIDGWYITQVHLEVATTQNEIPQSKGNPVPGHFTYCEEGLWTKDYEFDPIALSWSAGTTLYIAAHANVAQVESGNLVLESQAGVPVYGPMDHYAEPYHLDWGSTPTSSVATWKHGSWPMIPSSSAVWISTAYYIENARPDSWRWFHLAFNVPGVPTGGNIVTANSDNAEEVYSNGVLIGSDGTVTVPFDASGGDPHEWSTIKNYGFNPVYGANTLDFIVHNYAYPTDSPTVNPTGLIYKVNVDYLKIVRCETAWGAGTAFSGKNWATYFTYEVQWIFLETLNVDSKSTSGTTSTNSLATDKSYKFVVTGTFWRNTGGTPNQLCDAEYTTYDGDNWTPPHDGCLSYTTGWLAGWTTLGANFADLQVNGAFVDWGTFSSSHIYTYICGTGTGLTVNFRIFDGYGDTNTQMPGWYGDNSGSLTVEIYIGP